MKDIWLMIVGDMPVALQWAGAIVGLVLAMLLLVAGGFGVAGPPRAIKQGFTENAVTLPAASALAYLDRHLGTVVNVAFWLVAGTLGGYVTAVVIYLTWPWCVLVVAVIAGAALLVRRWWHRRMGSE